MSKLKQEAFAKLLVKTGLSQDELKSMGIDVLEASSNEGRIVDNATRVLTNQQDFVSRPGSNYGFIGVRSTKNHDF